MNNDNGQMYFSIGLDNSQLRAEADESRNILSGIGKAATSAGGELDNAFHVDASSIKENLEQVQEAARKATQILADVGKSFDTSSVEDKILALQTVIRDNEDVIRSMNLRLEEYNQTAKDAFASGDMGLFEAVTKDVEEQIIELQSLCEETDNYRTVLENLQGASGNAGATPTAAPMLFSSQEDYEYAQRLREKIEELQDQIARFDGSDADLQQLRNALATTQQQLGTCEDAAAQAASRLGADLGGRASEASTQLYELNAAIEKQKEVVGELQSAVEEASAAYETLKASEDTQATDEALIKYQALSESLQNATNELYNLQAAQTDASASWANVNAECERADSVLVKLLGGQEKYNSIMAQLPQPLQAAASGITGMTGAAKAFIATPLGAILAAIILAVKALTTWFHSSVEGQMAFAKVSGYVSGILGQLKEIVITVGKAIYSAFSNPKKAIGELWEAIKTNVVNRFKSVGEIASSLGKILKAAFTLDVDGIKSGLKDLTNGFLKFGTGIDNVTGKIGDWVDGVHKAASETSEIAVQQRQLEVEVSEWQKEKAKLDKVKAEARTKMYDTNLSSAERKKALQAYKDAVQKQLEQEQKFADKRIELQKRTMDLTSNTIEDENKLRDLEAARTQVDVAAQNELAMLQRRSNTIERGGATSQEKEQERQRKAEQQAEKRRAEELTALKDKNRQAEIDAMKNDADKKIAQINFDYDREIDAIKKQQKKWEDAQKGVLTSEQKDAIDNAIKNAAKTRDEDTVKANKESLDKMISDILTYEQKRLQVAEEFEKKRKALYETDDKGNYAVDENGNKKLRKGVTQGNVDELNRQQEESENAINEQFAQREETYKAWCNEIASLTLEQLRSVLEQAESELKKLEQSGTASDSQLAVARAKVTTAKNKVSAANAKNEVNPKKRSIKEWEDLYKVLNECEKEFESIGDTVGGVAGEIISAAGSIMTSSLSMINGIMQLVNMSTTGIQATATASAKAIQTVEKASVILTIISAALQIAMQIVNLFNNDEEKQKEIEALQNRIDQLQWELDNADIVRLQENSGKAVERIRQVLAETKAELIQNKLAVNDVAGAWRTLFSSVANNQDLLAKSAKKIADAYANIAYTADKALGNEKYASSKDSLNNIAKQQLLIQQQINAENDKKHTDHGKIEDWERQIEELGKQAIAIINDMVEDIIGGSSSDIAKQLSDAFFDAFQNGEDAAEAWGNKVNEIVADVLKRMLVSKFLEEPLGQIFDKYKAKWFKDGQFMGLDAVIESMSGFANDLNAVGDDFTAIWDALPDSIKNMFTVTSDATREASEKGIATASQESVDELNGRATAIQGHTYSISENTKLLVATTNLILQSVLNIESNTDGILSRIENVDKNVKELRDTVNDMDLKGVKYR
ncbi:hypothetical protein [Bacteroides sp.]|uniref:hypothetical protein n=1 Tax=Bacteroides sp. TaxID=29523 RepID=UPI002A7EDBD9|nr:hypothetical protein [Bacteroides sp.]